MYHDLCNTYQLKCKNVSHKNPRMGNTGRDGFNPKVILKYFFTLNFSLILRHVNKNILGVELLKLHC